MPRLRLTSFAATLSIASSFVLLGVHAGCSTFGDEAEEQQDSGGVPKVEAGLETSTTDAPIPVEDSGPDATGDASVATLCPKGACRLVFVTSSIYSGAFANGAVGGTAGDAQCLSAVASSGRPFLLDRKFRAWLSTVNVGAEDRFTKGKVPFRRLDGRIVASSWAALTSGNLEAPIALTEGGSTVLLDNVWTGTAPDGKRGGDTCESWTSMVGAGQIGHANKLDSTWTQDSVAVSCMSTAHLYCVEEP